MTNAWAALPESIRDQWKGMQATPERVVRVENRTSGSKLQWAAWTDSHRYVWTFVRGRQQWVIRKTELYQED